MNNFKYSTSFRIPTFVNRLKTDNWGYDDVVI